MKNFIACLLILLLFSATGFAENIVLDNETTYPLKHQKSKIAIQWAVTTKDMQEANKALIYGVQLDQNSIQMISKTGELTLSVPKNAGHFRVLVWSKDTQNPDLLTNWVDVTPGKIYKLKKDQLVPTVLMSGAGC